MTMQQEMRGDVLVIRPIGRLDSNNSPELERILSEHLEKGVQRVLFDLSELDYISSAGLRVILIIGKKLRTTGKLVLMGIHNPAVRDIFEMSGFLTLFEVVPDLEQGLKKF